MPKLADKYLPGYHFNERHGIMVAASPGAVFSCVDDLDLSGSIVIKILFLLRGMPSAMLRKSGLQKQGFIELERVPPTEIAIGLIGQFWKPDGNLQDFKPEDFITTSPSGFAKAVWTFEVTPQEKGISLVTTETRIFCTDEQARKRFSMYWLFIRPFSGLIRKEILKAIKTKAEDSQRSMQEL